MPHVLIRRRAVLGGLLMFPLAVQASGMARAQAALNSRNLTGVWRGTYREFGVVIVGEVIFQPNGSFRHTQALDHLMVWATGDYKIVQNWIHFEIDNYGPEEYQGVKQYRPQSETWVVDYFDGPTIDARIGDQTEVHYEKVD